MRLCVISYNLFLKIIYNMNILEHYDVNKLKLSDPYNIDDDTFFCKFSYNNMPFISLFASHPILPN